MEYQMTPKEWGELPKDDQFFLETAWEMRKNAEREESEKMQQHLED